MYHRSRVVCCPLLAGGGTRIKILEAAAYGKPIVTTRIGAEGIEMRDGYELVQRDDPEAFAASCLDLLENPDLCKRLGAAAHAAVVQRYDRSKIVPLIQRHLSA